MDLWIRTDIFASIQLHQFGYSLKKIKSLNPTWFEDAINKIKNGESGQRRGAVLEVLIASQFHRPPDRIVELPRPNTPGYDIKVKLNDSAEIYCQVKNNFGSGPYNKMKEKARSIEEVLIANLGDRALHIKIKTETEPNDGDWNLLREQLPTIMNDASSEGDIERDIERGWNIKVLHGTGSYLHPSKKSYALQLMTPISRQEQDGIYTDINDACDDLEKKEEPDIDKSINIAIVCIPLDLPFALAGKWVADYFTEFSTARVSGVLLYKPGVVTDMEKGEEKFTHAYHLILKRDKEDWMKVLTASNSLDIVVGSGTISVEGRSNMDNYNLLYGGETRENYLGYHVYQSGHINYGN